MKFIIFWYIHKKCNQQCWYCYEQGNEIKEVVPSRFHIDRIIKLFSSLPNFTLSLLGGEISIYSELEYLVQQVSKLQNVDEIQITTNGTNIHHNILDIDKVRINLSLHLDYFNRFDLLKYDNVHPTLIYDACSPEYADEVLEFHKMPVKLVRRNHNVFNYTEHELETYYNLLKKYGLEDRKDRYIPHKVAKCNKGYQLRFDYDGKIYHTDYKCLLERGVNIYINPQDFVYKKEEFICTQELCYGFNNCCRNIPKVEYL